MLCLACLLAKLMTQNILCSLRLPVFHAVQYTKYIEQNSHKLLTPFNLG
ncbi:GSDH domain-containing protein [Psidium guajava]|nr:GSDH domain-containing protein [Psidium guajava]